MSSIFLFMSDLKQWLRRYNVTLIVLAVLCFIAVLVAGRNAAIADAQTVFLESRDVTLRFIRGEVGVFNVLLSLLFEWAIVFVIIIAASYNGFTVYFAFSTAIYLAYVLAYNVIIVIKTHVFAGVVLCAFSAIAFCITFMVIAYAIIKIIDSQCCYSHGIGEIKAACALIFPCTFFMLVVVLLRILVLSIAIALI